jgi:DNA-binding transcriptional ArsR family regulator
MPTDIDSSSEPTPDAALDAIFHALSDNTRRKLMRTLASGDYRVSDLAKPHDMSLAAISKHVKVLERAGLVTRLRSGSEHFIQLRTPSLKRAAEWLDFYQQFWTAQLESLEDLLQPRK